MLANITENESKLHEAQMKIFESPLKITSDKCLFRFQSLIKSQFSFDYEDYQAHNETIFKDVLAFIGNMYKIINEMNEYLIKNKTKSYTYYVWQDL